MASEPKWTRDRVMRFGAGPRLDALVAEHVMGFKRTPLQYSRRRWWWVGKVGGQSYHESPEDWNPSCGQWDSGTVSWTQALTVVHRLHDLGWHLDLEDHTQDRDCKRGHNTWWYELCHYELCTFEQGKPKRLGPVHYWQLDGGDKSPHVSICKAALCAVLVAPTLP